VLIFGVRHHHLIFELTGRFFIPPVRRPGGGGVMVRDELGRPNPAGWWLNRHQGGDCHNGYGISTPFPPNLGCVVALGFGAREVHFGLCHGRPARRCRPGRRISTIAPIQRWILMDLQSQKSGGGRFSRSTTSASSPHAFRPLPLFYPVLTGGGAGAAANPGQAFTWLRQCKSLLSAMNTVSPPEI